MWSSIELEKRKNECRETSREIEKNIGKRIKFYREYRDMTQETLGFYMGLDKRTVGNWESGRNLTTLPNLIHISIILNINFSDLVPLTIKK